MRKILFAATAALGMAYASLAGGPIDGTVWDVKVKPDAFFALSHRDTLVFAKGRLSVAGYPATGFEPAVYSASDVVGDAGMVFAAALSDAEKGVVSWQGLVRGDSIEGVAVWWAKSGRPQRFSFKGTRKNDV